MFNIDTTRGSVVIRDNSIDISDEPIYCGAKPSIDFKFMSPKLFVNDMLNPCNSTFVK